jgi:hypothetical protein
MSQVARDRKIACLTFRLAPPAEWRAYVCGWTVEFECSFENFGADRAEI